MANTTLTASIISKAAIAILDNELVMAKNVFRGYEEDYNVNPNGYKPGATITVRRPADFTVRDGATASSQDVTEGSTSITVDKQKGVDFEFTSSDLTLKIEDLSERVIKPAMVQLANQMDTDLLALYKDVNNWVGTPGQTIDSFNDYNKAATRLNMLAVPLDGRFGALSPTDYGAMVGAQTALYINAAASSAYRAGSLGDVGGVMTGMSQNVPTHTVGALGGTPLVNGGSQNVTYATVKDAYYQNLVTDGWSNSITGVVKAGDVFTIAGVYAVNPVTKATLPYLQQFTVRADANSGASTGPATISIQPPIITSGAFQTCSAAPADNAAITMLGSAATGYAQNLVFRKNAFALVNVPMVSPPGAVDVSRRSYKGLNVRVIPYYDGTNDVSKWRLDVLYGVKTIDPRQAVRVSGTA